MTKAFFCFNENDSKQVNQINQNGDTSTLSGPFAKAVFICLPSSHPFVDKEVYLTGKIRIGRTYMAEKKIKDKLFFDSKVLSKNHALIWYDNGKFFIKDTKSSNGTFVNGNRLSAALEESDDYQIFSDDAVQFGVEVTETVQDKEFQNVHSGVYTLLKLYHPNGSLAIKPIETNESINSTCPNISVRQLNILHDCIKLSMNRENILKEKLAFLQLQLTNLEESTRKKWDFVIDEDLLLTKIETLQNRLESILNTNNLLKNSNDEESKSQILRKEIEALQDQEEIYQFEFKNLIKKSYDDKRTAEAKLQETEIKLNFALKEIKHIESLVNKYRSELNSADSQILFLDDELKTYKLETKKLSDEKQLFKKQIQQLEENENLLNEIIKDLKLELENQQLELKSIDVFEDVTNCSKNLNFKNDLEHSPNTQLNPQTNNHCSTINFMNNGKLPISNNDFYVVKNCTDFFDCPINKQSSQRFLKLLNNYLNESKDSTSTNLEKNEQILRHALAILVLENTNLIKQLEEKQILKSQPKSVNSINLVNSVNSDAKFTSSLENHDAILVSIQSVINNQKALIKKENDLSSLNKLVSELERSYCQLKSEYEELEFRIQKKGKLEEELIVRKDVQNLLDSVIEKVETKITQQEFDGTIKKLNEVQSDYDKLKIVNARIRKQNDVITEELKTLKEEYEMISYQNKMAHLLALIPITVLIVSIILAYLPWISTATGTKDV